ncbi:recombinase family protein [Clostridium grantii]|uniref:Site-specific DNA recombinase n=1 Tax=Clostridium grantii DSM 8605 TaxID=1121316 RepID=A0A1M5RF07_9CLOT|nr:recombinase family protein [Clostridium grantii]SHH24700.1 site-specific DNA recombinase [Clostridium grantii DSM 8605]
MKAAIYSRKSKFTGKGESIENQIDLCKEYCIKNNIDVYEVYEDEGFSGGNTQRPRFKKMLKDAKDNKFNFLVCYRLDRISRNVADFSTTLESLQGYDIDFVSIREQFDTSTPMGRAMVYISSVFAQLERETIAERVRDNMHQLARTGRWLGGRTPLGFISEQIKYLDANLLERKLYKLVPVPEELKLVETIYNKYLELKSLSRLESDFLINGISTRSDKKYDMSTLKVILTNPAYVIADELFYEYCIKHNMDVASTKDEFDGNHSVMVFNKHKHANNRVKLNNTSEWIVSIAKHEGIIPSKDWIRIQDILKYNSSKTPRTGTSKVALLTTILVCSKCGSKMRITGKYKEGELQHHYYKCRLKERSKGTLCDMKNLNGYQAEKIVFDEMKKLALNKSIISKGFNESKEKLKKESSNASMDILSLEKRIKEKEKGIQNLTIQLSQNASSTAATYIIKQIETLDNELKQLKLQYESKEEIKQSNKMEQMNLELKDQLIKEFALNCNNMPFEKQKELLTSIIDKITWDGENLDIKLF